MLARFDSQINQGSRLQRSGTPVNRLWLVTGVLAVLLFGWLFYRYVVQPDWLGRLPSIFAEFLFLVEMASLITLAILTGLALWQQRAQPRSPSVLTVDQMHALSPRAFETFS